MRIALLLCALGCGARPEVKAADVATLALIDGDVWATPKATAIAIKGDAILAVGSDAAVKAYIGPGTRIVDLHGRSVTAGLVDAHCHLYELGEDLEAVDLRGRDSEADSAKLVVDAATQRSSSEWLIGRGWDQNRWPGQQFPTRASLDAVTDRPVFLTRVDGHAAWVNSKALAAAGIAKATPDPAGGKIVRDAKGEPTGVLVDNAMELVVKVRPVATPEQRERRIRAAAKLAIAAGLTGVHEMGIEDATADVYRKLAAAHELPLRVNAYLLGDVRHLDRLSREPEPPTGRFAMHGVKFFADGALGSRGARLYADYDDEPGNRGLWVTEPAKLAAGVEAAVAHGWQVATHAIGDAGVGSVLDAYLAAERAHPGEHRLRVEHTQVIAPTDVPRMIEAHAIASMQPTHATSDMPWAEARIGHERIKGAYAWRTMLDHHIPVAAGSDFPVEQVSPLLGVYAAVTRQDATGNPPGGWYPDQRMTLAEAIDAFTRSAAYAEFTEASRGVLAVGRHADLTVYDGILAPDKTLLALGILMTIVDGEIVFEHEQTVEQPIQAGR